MNADNNFRWKVVPISPKQKLDVREEDLFGDFRLCETYRGGGGYDKFPEICERRLGKKLHKQFIVQLRGCNLECPYCYVTQEGIWGQANLYTSQQLVDNFLLSKQEIFHLMGGAPALYLTKWKELLKIFHKDKVFHSDFLLSEFPYKLETLLEIAKFTNTLFAVSIKGTNRLNYKVNTGKDFNESLILANLDLLIKAKINFYITFTGISAIEREVYKDKLKIIFGETILKDSFDIDLINYRALEI